MTLSGPFGPIVVSGKTKTPSFCPKIRSSLKLWSVRELRPTLQVLESGHLGRFGASLTPMPLDLSPLRFVTVALAGWLNQQQQDIIDYRREENS